MSWYASYVTGKATLTRFCMTYLHVLQNMEQYTCMYMYARGIFNTVYLRIKGIIGLRGGRAVPQLVTDHDSFSDAEIAVVTDVAPYTGEVDLDTTGRERSRRSSVAPQTHSALLLS